MSTIHPNPPANPPSNPKAIIFDLDGTLIDTAPIIADAFNRIWVDMGHAPLSVDYVESFIGTSAPFLFKNIFNDQGIAYDDAFIDAKLADYMVHYRANSQQKVPFFPHVEDDLKTLKNMGYQLGICTNKIHDLTELVLEKQGLSHLIDVFRGCDAVPNRKPHADHLKAVMDAMGVSAGETFYVGDTDTDRKCAKDVGVPCFLVPWGGGKNIQGDHDCIKISRLLDILNYCAKK